MKKKEFFDRISNNVLNDNGICERINCGAGNTESCPFIKECRSSKSIDVDAFIVYLLSERDKFYNKLTLLERLSA